MKDEPWYRHTSTILVHKFRDAHDDTQYEVIDDEGFKIGIFFTHEELMTFLDGKIKKMEAYL